MADTTMIKVDAAHSPKGPHGKVYLAGGRTVSMRLWQDEESGEPKEAVRRDYETVGYAISGRAELTIEGQTVMLSAGSSWVVPKGAGHAYGILERFTAVEATSPPAQVQGCDD